MSMTKWCYFFALLKTSLYSSNLLKMIQPKVIMKIMFKTDSQKLEILFFLPLSHSLILTLSQLSILKILKKLNNILPSAPLQDRYPKTWLTVDPERDMVHHCNCK